MPRKTRPEPSDDSYCPPEDAIPLPPDEDFIPRKLDNGEPETLGQVLTRTGAMAAAAKRLFQALNASYKGGVPDHRVRVQAGVEVRNTVDGKPIERKQVAVMNTADLAGGAMLADRAHREALRKLLDDADSADVRKVNGTDSEPAE